jgi:DNA-binding response OmpR family regulator
MPNILVVEDDANLGSGIEYSLKKEGFSVILAGSMERALEASAKGPFDLAILDIKLPDGDGYTLYGELNRLRKTPVIFLSACDEEVNIVMGLDMGGDDYITKPFRVGELVSRIRAVLRRNGVQSGESLVSSGGLTINTWESKAYKNGEALQLTALEYRLLLKFVQNPQKVLSRNALLSAIWDVDAAFADDNTLSVYIRRLREKVEDDPNAPKTIETVRGLGYRWNA